MQTLLTLCMCVALSFGMSAGAPVTLLVTGPHLLTSEALTQLMREDTARWKQVIETAQIRID